MKWEEVPLVQSLEEMHNAKGIAEILGLSAAMIQKWRMEFDLPYVRLGKVVYFSETQVVWWINNFQRTVPDKVAIWGRAMKEKARIAKLGNK